MTGIYCMEFNLIVLLLCTMLHTTHPKDYIDFICSKLCNKLSTMVKKLEQNEDLERHVKGKRAQLWLNNYTRKKINMLMDTGDFESVSYLLKVSVHRLAAGYELGVVKITNTKIEKQQKKAINDALESIERLKDIKKR
jgi:hypothetical protein